MIDIKCMNFFFFTLSAPSLNPSLPMFHRTGTKATIRARISDEGVAVMAIHQATTKVKVSRKQHRQYEYDHNYHKKWQCA